MKEARRVSIAVLAFVSVLVCVVMGLVIFEVYHDHELHTTLGIVGAEKGFLHEA